MDDQNIDNSDEPNDQDGDVTSKEDKIFQEEMDELEKVRKEHQEKKKEQLERIRKDREKNKRKIGKEREPEDPRIVAGQVVPVEKKTYKHEVKLFRHKRLNDFSGKGLTKINKTLKGVHGVSVQKKVEFIKALKAYNPSKSVLKKDDFVDFARRFKSKRFTGKAFKKLAREGIDIKAMRKKFGKRDIDKLRRGITGEEDPNRYRSSSSDTKKTVTPPANLSLRR
ncbi:hypothetical protein KAJ41_03315 [Candidatus Parcubacteria bacterium]|nr:hypothetical protein [Candidatus Parcubacteria bacterium]